MLLRAAGAAEAVQMLHALLQGDQMRAGGLQASIHAPYTWINTRAPYILCSTSSMPPTRHLCSHLATSVIDPLGLPHLLFSLSFHAKLALHIFTKIIQGGQNVLMATPPY